MSNSINLKTKNHNFISQSIKIGSIKKTKPIFLSKEKNKPKNRNVLKQPHADITLSKK